MFFDIIGWIGMILVLTGYILLSTKKIDNGKLYQYINLFAACFMAIGVFPKHAWFSFVLEVAWGIIALVMLFKIYTKKQF